MSFATSTTIRFTSASSSSVSTPRRPEVVGLDVQHRADVCTSVAHAALQQPAARGLQHRRVDRRVAQHHAGRDRPGHVAVDRQVAVDVDAVGRGRPTVVPASLKMCATIRAVVVLPFVPVIARSGCGRGARREEHVHHRPGDVARRALARRHVHAEARGGVDLADRAPRLLVGARDVGGEEVDAGHVEADRPAARIGHLAVVRVHDVGHVDGGAAGGEVAGRAQEDDLAVGGHRSRCSPSAPAGARPGGRTRAGSGPSRADAAARIAFTLSTSSSIVCSPSPTTWPGTRLATAISSPSTTSIRWSKPSMKLSTMTVRPCSRACAKAARPDSARRGGSRRRGRGWRSAA